MIRFEGLIEQIPYGPVPGQAKANVSINGSDIGIDNALTGVADDLLLGEERNANPLKARIRIEKFPTNYSKNLK